MTSDADSFWDEIAPKYRTYRGLSPMTAQQADAAFDDAPAIPMTAEEIQRIVNAVVAGEQPTWEPEATGWSRSENLEQVESDMLAVYREQGETDPETEAKEEELRNRMLNDESPDEQNGVDGGATPEGEGGKDG
jgi:hypothetical protein